MMIMFPGGYETAKPGTLPDHKAMEVTGKYNEQLHQAGMLLALEGLHSPSMDGARVTFKGGKSNVTDGPFPEAEEVVGGFWLIQVKSRKRRSNGRRASPARTLNWSKYAGCLTQPTSMPKVARSSRSSSSRTNTHWATSSARVRQARSPVVRRSVIAILAITLADRDHHGSQQVAQAGVACATRRGLQRRLKNVVIGAGHVLRHSLNPTNMPTTFAYPPLQQAASLDRQIIQGHLQLRNGRADFWMLSYLLLQCL